MLLKWNLGCYAVAIYFGVLWIRGMKQVATKSGKATINFMRDPKGSDPSKDDELLPTTGGWKVWKWAVFVALTLFVVLPAGCVMLFGHAAKNIMQGR